MSQNYGKYQKCFERSVKHIFEHFLGDPSIHSVVESQRARKNHSVWVEVDGSFNGEVHLCFPESTMKEITALVAQGETGKSAKQIIHDVAGELGNMITGTFANQLQYLNHTIRLCAPEFEEDPIPLKTFYDNVSLSFNSRFGGFDAEVYFKIES